MTSIKVLFYNTHLFDRTAMGCFDPELLYKDEDRRDEIIERLKNSGADIIGLCEVWSVEYTTHISDKLKYLYPFSCASPLGKWFVTGGLLLLSKHHLYAHFDKYTAKTGTDAWANKGVISARVQVAGADLNIFLTHMQSGEDDDERSARSQQLEQLQGEIKEDLGVPAIILGDLAVPGNPDGSTDDPTYPEYNDMMTTFSMDELGENLVDSCPAHSEDPTYTYTWDPSRNKLAEHFYADQDPTRADYIFFSEGDWEKVEAQVITDWTFDDPDADGMDCSDHYPVMATLNLQKLVLDAFVEVGRGSETNDDRFSDSETMVDKGSITKIKVCCEKMIDSIQLWYGGEEGEEHGGPGGNPQEWEIPAGDKIVRIEGRAQDGIDQLEFITAKGLPSPTYGGPGGQPFEVQASPGGELITIQGTHGRVGTYKDVITSVKLILGPQIASLIVGGGYKAGDDWQYDSDDTVNQGSITQIKVYCKKMIDSIQQWYGDTAGGKLGGDCGDEQEPWQIPAGDKIVLVKGRYQKGIDQLQFFTDKGTASPAYGGSTGKPFEVHASPGGELKTIQVTVGDVGTYKDVITSAQFFFEESLSS